MSEVLHSAGVPGATRCSGSATGTAASIPAGDPQRVDVAHDCACEIDALVRLALAIRNTIHDDSPMALRGVLLRVLSLTDAQMAMLDCAPMPRDEWGALQRRVSGDDQGALEVGQ